MKPAGFWIRFAAYLIDSIIVGIPVYIIQFILSFLFIGGVGLAAFSDPYATEPPIGLIVLYFILTLAISLAVSIGYYGLMTASKHQATLGKKLLGLKVVNEYGETVSKGQAIGRYFAYILSGIFYIGFIMIAFGNKQGLHDKICKTYVVYRD